MTRKRRIRELVEGFAEAGAAGDIRVPGLSVDSRQVQRGEAFVALRGTRTHGIEFAPAALAQGASVILAEAPGPAVLPAVEPVVWIERLSERLGEIAARFFEHPSRSLAVVGVTGTNGKTSTVQLLAQAFEHLGCRTGSIGTLGAGVSGELAAGERTTPDAIQVQGLLAAFLERGTERVAMEVSSHALEQGRVNAVEFMLAVFTNLSRDHLDYHGSMQAYGAAKARLFAWPSLQHAVINIDDAFGRELVRSLPGHVNLLRYALDDDSAEVRGSDILATDAGIEFSLHSPWGNARVGSALLGRFNVANLLAVATCLGALDVDFARIVTCLQALQPVPGRMSRLGGADRPLVVIDYAHTPDALEQALRVLGEHRRGRLICVFGCGGERDPGKRPLMGAIAERLADVLFVTDDNPRGEDGDRIVAQILAGMQAPVEARVERDRGVAIARALELAHAGDVVLIAGKGHEAYQDSGGVRRAFDDLAVARASLEARA